MNVQLSLVIAVVASIALVGLIALFGLLFRGPACPAWLRRDSAASAVSVLVSGALFGVGAYLISSLLDAGLTIIAAVAVSVGLLIGSGMTVVRLFRIKERLRRADAGQSPFGPLGGVAEKPDTAGRRLPV